MEEGICQFTARTLIHYMKSIFNYIVGLIAAMFGTNDIESTYADDTTLPPTVVPRHKPISPCHRLVPQIPRVSAIVAPSGTRRAPEQVPVKKSVKQRWMCFWKKDRLDTISARLVVRPDGKAVKAVYLSQKGNILRAKVRRIDDHEVHIQKDNRGPVFSRLVVGSQPA